MKMILITDRYKEANVGTSFKTGLTNAVSTANSAIPKIKSTLRKPVKAQVNAPNMINPVKAPTNQIKDFSARIY